MITAGIDVGSSAVKLVVMRVGDEEKVLAKKVVRLRRRDPTELTEREYPLLLEEAGVRPDEVCYVATTGEGDRIELRTGHFYGMTAHARGARFLDPEARAVLDVGGLHARAILMDARSKVLSYRMTSQCASGSGQFLENISRYLGVTLEEIGELSLEADEPEKCSSICAVLAETDVINMVSRGITVPNVLRGIHDSMAGRYVRLLVAAGAKGVVVLSGGLAADRGLVGALQSEAQRQKADLEMRAHADSVFAGAIGAALWGGFRHEALQRRGIDLGATVAVEGG